MYKLLIFAAIVAFVAFAASAPAPAPAPEPGVAFAAPFGYKAPLAYSPYAAAYPAPVAYAGYSGYSAPYAAPVATYPAYSPYTYSRLY